MGSKTALPPFPLHLSPTPLLPPSSPGAPPAALTSRPFLYTESSPSIPWLATDDVVESNSPDVRRLFFYFVMLFFFEFKWFSKPFLYFELVSCKTSYKFGLQAKSVWRTTLDVLLAYFNFCCFCLSLTGHV